MLIVYKLIYNLKHFYINFSLVLFLFYRSYGAGFLRFQCALLMLGRNVAFDCSGYSLVGQAENFRAYFGAESAAYTVVINKKFHKIIPFAFIIPKTLSLIRVNSNFYICCFFRQYFKKRRRNRYGEESRFDTDLT